MKCFRKNTIIDIALMRMGPKTYFTENRNNLLQAVSVAR